MDGYVLVGDRKVYRADVTSCEDVAQLREWHAVAYDTYDAVMAHVDVYRGTGTRDDNWIRRASDKAVSCNVMMRWIERRVAELDMPVIATRKGAERDQLRRAREEIKALRARVTHLELAAAGREGNDASQG